MQKLKKRKGFTLTELAIVIAVIAILIAVLVPTFVSLINKANQSNDSQLVKNFNTSLSTDETINGEHETVIDAIDVLLDDGYDLTKLTPTANNADIVYNATTHLFVYYTDDFSKLSYGEVNTDDILVVITDETLSRAATVNASSITNEVYYCVYEEEGANVSYADAATIYLYTESGTTTIDATKATVYRYGASAADSVAVADNSYHLYGTVETVTLVQGHVELTSTAVVEDLVVENTTETQKVTYVKGAQITNIVDNNTGSNTCTYVAKTSDSDEGTECKDVEEFSTTAEATVVETVTVAGVEIEGYGTASNPYQVTKDNYSGLFGEVINGYAVLTEDITGSITITAGSDVILDLSTYTIEASTAHTITVSSGATLTVTGSEGTISNTATSTYNAINNSGTLIVNSGNISSNYITITIAADASATINDGTISGVCVIKNDGNLTIENGTITATKWLQNDSGATITINGGTINGQYGLYNYGGTAVITGGTLIGSEHGIATKLDGTRTSISGDAVIQSYGKNTNGVHGIYITEGYTAYLEISGNVTITAYNSDTTTGYSAGIAYFGTSSTEITESPTVTIKISGGTISGGNYGIMGYGQKHNSYVTITGGEISGNYAYFHPENGVLNISGGTFTGYKTAIEIRAGEVNISGGTFKSTATTFSATANNSGTTIVGAAVAVSQHTTNLTTKVTISGGTFEGYYAVYEEDLQDETVDCISVYITGGTYTGYVYSENIAIGTLVSGYTYSETTLDEKTVYTITKS